MNLVRTLVLAIVICSQLSLASAEINKGSVYISGSVAQYKAKEITFYYIKDYLYFQRKIIKTVQTDKHGKFELTFPWESPWQVQMIIGETEFTLFLCPGDSLLFKANYWNLKPSIKYSGNAGYGHNALKDYMKKFNNANEKFSVNMVKYDSLEFTTMNDMYHNEQIDSIRKDSALIANRNFYEYLKSIADCNYYTNIFSYCKAKKHFFDSTYMFGTIDKKFINNEYALSQITFIDFVEKYIAWKSEVTKSEHDTRNYWDFRYRTIKKSLSGKVRDILLARTVKKAFEYANHITAMSLYYDYKNTSINHDYLQQIRNEFIH